MAAPSIYRNSFYLYRGLANERVPLVYPYQLTDLGFVSNNGLINHWSEAEAPSFTVEAFAVERNYILGFWLTDSLPRQNQWFIFDTETGALTSFDSKDGFDYARASLGLDTEATFFTVDEQLFRYWSWWRR